MTEDNALGRIKQDLLDLAGFAYRRLRGRLEGLTDEEYLWEPAPGCWSVRPAGDGTFRSDGSGPAPVDPPPLTTIAWRLSHIIDILAGERNATWLGATPLPGLDRAGDPGTAGAAIDQLDQAYQLFAAHVAAADAATLTVALGPIAGPFADSTRAAFVLHELDELIHHGAEVATLRDLYRATRPEEPIVDACRRADRAAVESLLAAEPGLFDAHPALLARMAAARNWPAVRLLVDLGFDVNASAGVSALHHAAGAGELSIVEFLVKRGADRTAEDTTFGKPPAGWARYLGHEEVAAYLDAPDR